MKQKTQEVGWDVLFFFADGLIVGLTHLARLNLHKAGAGGFEELQAWRTESKHQRNLLAHLRCRGWDVVLPIKNLHLPSFTIKNSTTCR